MYVTLDNIWSKVYIRLYMYRLLTYKIDHILSNNTPPIIMLLGLRQTGKTTLAKNILKNRKYQSFNFDLYSDRQEFVDQNRHSLELFAQRYKNQIILIDEFQKAPEATNIVKHLFDHYKIKFFLTGSSELKMRKNAGDTLAGRLAVFNIYPLSIKEILIQKNIMGNDDIIPHDPAMVLVNRILVHGSLPNIDNTPPSSWEQFLKDFTETLLSRDVLEVAEVRKPTKIFSLAKLLALQIGQLVNVNELATLIESPRATVYNYLDILEQMSIIKRAHSISTNEREAISTKFKVYFTDLGIRNFLVGNFYPLNSRNDIGQLLENFAFINLKRTYDYSRQNYRLGFFRSANGTEIDFVLKSQSEKSGEKLFEVKAKVKRKSRLTNINYIDLENVYTL